MWNPFSHTPQASIFQASDGERHEAIEKLVSAATMRQGYYLLLSLSVIIVTLGLLAGNGPIVIGGVVIAPVLTPILLMAVSAVSSSMRGVSRASQVLAVSVALTLLLSWAMTWIISVATPVPTLMPPAIHPLIYLIVALCSGIVASLGWVKKEFSATIAGIAISVSVLPPLCIAGIGFAHGKTDMMLSTMGIFITNVAGILGAAIVTFIALGFARFGRVTEKTLLQEKHASDAA